MLAGRSTCQVVPLRRSVMRLPTISVVTCSYQQARYLEQAIRSVVEQDYPRLEYIVIDGGSTDGSREVIAQHAASLAHWISESDRGQTDALQKGFRRARGEICGWLCSDDLLLPGALRAVATYFSSHPGVVAAYGDALWIDDAGRFLRPKREMSFNRFVFLHDHNYVPQPSMFWRREVYEAVGGLDPTFDLAMDADLWERLSRQGRVGHIPHYLSCMRFYPEQKTRRRHSDATYEHRLIGRRRGVESRGVLARGTLRVAARCLRVASKALAGGYGARVPQDHLAWLERCASTVTER